MELWERWRNNDEFFAERQGVQNWKEDGPAAVCHVPLSTVGVDAISDLLIPQTNPCSRFRNVQFVYPCSYRSPRSGHTQLTFSAGGQQTKLTRVIKSGTIFLILFIRRHGENIERDKQNVGIARCPNLAIVVVAKLPRVRRRPLNAFLVLLYFLLPVIQMKLEPS